MWVNPNAQQRQLYDLPSLHGEPVSLTVGYRTLLAAAASPALLHFTFTQLCQAATAVMDYLTLCESYAVWLLDEVPPLATVGPAAQQRFINVIDVLYEKQIRLLLVTRCDRRRWWQGGTGGYSTNAESTATAAAGGIENARREPGERITDRSGRGSSPWSGRQRSHAPASAARRRRRTLPPGRAVPSWSQTPDPRGWRCTSLRRFYGRCR